MRVLLTALLEDELPTAAVMPPSVLNLTFLGGGLTEAVCVLVDSDPLLGFCSPIWRELASTGTIGELFFGYPSEEVPRSVGTRHHKRYTAQCRGPAAGASTCLRSNNIGVVALTIRINVHVCNPYQLHRMLNLSTAPHVNIWLNMNIRSYICKRSYPLTSSTQHC